MVNELYSWIVKGKCHSLLLTFVTIIMLLNVELNEALYIYRLDYPVALITFFVALREDDQSWFWAFIWQIQVYGISSGYNHGLIVLLDRVVECWTCVSERRLKFQHSSEAIFIFITGDAWFGTRVYYAFERHCGQYFAPQVLAL